MICSRLRSLWKAKGEVTLGQRELLGTGSRLLSSLSPQSGSGTGAFPPHPRPKAREEGMDLEAGVGWPVARRSGRGRSIGEAAD